MDPTAVRAADLMADFADRTGVTSDRPRRRYLWTDAFAVCNFLRLGDTERALRLVAQVHETLGGLDGSGHPTRGGLRIGKPEPERGPDEPLDEDREWDRDGQYFHYLTKWMHALDQVTRWTGNAQYREWARELARTAHRAFTYAAPGGHGRRMYWKMSVDLSRPQVASMGQHDPLDGLVTALQLGLADLAADFGAMIEPGALATGDPLGIGGLLFDAYRIEQLTRGTPERDTGLLEALLEAALVGLQYGRRDTNLPAARRLAFRELGLAIGLAGVARMEREGDADVRHAVAPLAKFVRVRAEIDAFWLTDDHRRARSWLDHEDINQVMLATSVAPEGFLVLGPTGT